MLSRVQKSRVHLKVLFKADVEWDVSAMVMCVMLILQVCVSTEVVHCLKDKSLYQMMAVMNG